VSGSDVAKWSPEARGTRGGLMKQTGITLEHDGVSTQRDDLDARVSQLAALLFDLRAAHEADIRALTWVQRSLEGVRSGNAPGDPDLLLGEMARLFSESRSTAADVATRRQAAVELLESVITERRRAQAPKPVAIFAA
jgi:hypothetical protein